jgi:hypothetical protein
VKNAIEHDVKRQADFARRKRAEKYHLRVWNIGLSGITNNVANIV